MIFMMLLLTLTLEVDPSCNCPNFGSAVCAKNGVTYKNYCTMICFKQKLQKFGECKKVVNPFIVKIPDFAIPDPKPEVVPPFIVKIPDFAVDPVSPTFVIPMPTPKPKKPKCTKVCPNNVDWVCAKNKKSYRNPCRMICNNKKFVHKGKCKKKPKPCNCPIGGVDYVCGDNGKTYSSSCKAECKGVFIFSPGMCPGDCVCPAYVDPVCGDDGKTYSNAC